MRYVFLLLAIWGTVHPMYYFFLWFNENGYDIMAMVEAWHANNASSGLVWDLTVAAVALTVWVLYDVKTERRYVRLLAIPATFCIGVSCGLPLFIFFKLSPDRA